MTRVRSIALSLSLLLPAPLARGEDAMRPSDTGTNLYDITFDGGTFGAFVDMLREGMDGQVMFVTPVGAERVPMPPFRMHTVTFPDVLELASSVGQFNYRQVQAKEWANAAFADIEGLPVEGRPIITFEPRIPIPRDDAPLRLERIDFPGGTVGAYVRALQEAGGEGKVVLIGPPDALTLGPMTLIDARLESAVEILSGLRRNEQQRQAACEVGEFDGLYVVRVFSEVQRGLQGTRVWSLRGIVSDELDTDTLLGAIESGLQALDASLRPTMRFHEPTALLVAAGELSALEVVHQIIDGLEQHAAAGRSAPSPVDRMRTQRDVLSRAIQRREIQLRDTEDRVFVREREIEHATIRYGTLGQEGKGNSAEAAALTSKIAALNTSLEALRARIDAIEESRQVLMTMLGQLEELIVLVDQGELKPLPVEVLEQEFGIGDLD